MTIGYKSSAVVTAAILAAGLASAPAHAQFYKDKTITMLINYGAGGNTDTEGRVFQRHLSRHLAGSPNIVPQNRPGAGGLVGVNYMGSGAMGTDGLSIGFFTLNVVAPIIQDPALRVKYEDFAFITAIEQWIIAYGRRDIPPGMEKPSTIAKARDIFVAGYNPSTPHNTRINMTLDLIGAQYKVVNGYQSIGDINKSMLQKEVNFTTTSQPAFQNSVVPNLIPSGEVMPFWHYQVSSADGGFIGNKRLEAMGIPTFVDVYKEAHGKLPSGTKWEAFVLVNDIATQLLRSVVMPPGSPPEAVAEMRKALMALGTDQKFLDEYKKVIGTEPSLVRPEEGEAILERLKTVRPEVRDVLREVAGLKN
jgi:hypothetical protein